MRIGIDVRELCGRPTGVGRYLDGLLAEWSVDDRALRHEFVLYAHEAIPMSFDARRFATRVVHGAGGTLWEQRKLPAAVRRDHLDVFFAPGYTAPIFSRLPLVVAIHDVSFAAHPEWFGAREGFRRRVLTRRVARVARAITTLSDFSKHELMDLLHVPAAKIHVIRPGITKRSSGALHASSLTPRASAGILYVGSIFNRRHVPDLIQAFGQLARRHADVELDLVGDNRSHPREDIVAAIARQRVAGRARWHQYVSESDLGALYGAAGAFAFLSEYEGLGLTPLEALAAGVPSVLLDTPVARECCGDAALYVPQGNVTATVAALDALLFDPSTRSRLLAAAPALLERYDWPTAARQTLTVIEHAR